MNPSAKTYRCFFLFVVLAAITAAHAQAPAKPRPANASNPLNDPAVERRVESLLRQMTLAEKVGQTAQYSFGIATGPGTGRADTMDAIGKGQVGSLLNVNTAKQANAFQHAAMEKSRLHIPLLLGLDVIHGFRTTFPVPLGLASTWDPDLVQRTARIAAREAAASNIRWTFSPMVDIARDARWGRIVEGAGEDPFLGEAMARAYVRGYQGARLDSPDSIAACAKHYVGYGAAEGGREYNGVEISEHTLRQYYLPPFKAAAEAGAATYMSAFNSLNGMPASANTFTLTQVLRKEWGFRGLVVSDWTSITELIKHGIANDGPTAAAKAFNAGVDMDMESDLYQKHLAELVHSGRVSQATLDEAVRRILRVKVALGLFEHPYADEAAESAAMLRPDAVELAREAAERSFVLLKNGSPAVDEDGKATANRAAPVLPLSANAGTIALIGPMADNAANMIGSWGGQGKEADVVTLLAALRQRLGESRVKYSKGAEIETASEASIAEAVAAARQVDTVILALGEDAPKMTGEAASRAHPELPGQQQKLLEAVAATGKPVVLLLFTGRPLVIPWAFEHAAAVIEAWFPGVQAGPALVRTLFGESNPGGKLVVSWPRAIGQEPLYYNALNTGRPIEHSDWNQPQTDTKFESRYIDERNSPLFPFGFGLSYTTFSYGATTPNVKGMSARALRQKLSGATLAAATKPGAVIVTCEVSNTGSRAGEEIVQLYVRLEGTSTSQPVRALKGFQRVQLGPGEKKTVRFELGPDAFALWNDQNQYVVEPAKATIWVAPNSQQGTAAALEITE